MEHNAASLNAPVQVGSSVRILSVESCAHDLPLDDVARLRTCVGKVCTVTEIDKFGFVWVAVDGQPAYFCLLPEELQLADGGDVAV